MSDLICADYELSAERLAFLEALEEALCGPEQSRQEEVNND